MKIFIDQRGYFRFTDSNKLLHRWAAEKKLGRKLTASEEVHHIDRNKLNNHPENLFVCKDRKHHHRIHEIDARKYGWCVSLCGFK